MQSEKNVENIPIRAWSTFFKSLFQGPKFIVQSSNTTTSSSYLE